MIDQAVQRSSASEPGHAPDPLRSAIGPWQL
jgi:hypothetical protein